MPRASLLWLALAVGCTALPRATGPDRPGQEAEPRPLLDIVRRMADGLAVDPGVARAIRATADDPRAVVRLVPFEDFTGSSVDLEALREGLRLHLLESGRFRFASDGDGGEPVDLLLAGWLTPSEDGAPPSVCLFVLRALTPDRRRELWSRSLRLEAAAQPGTYRLLASG